MTITEITAYLTIVGALLSMIYVVGQSSVLKAATGWRLFFLAHHVALIAVSFSALWVNGAHAVFLALIWAVTMFALVVWHYKLGQRHG